MTVENHYLSKDDLTPHQKSKISELREKASKHLAKYPDYDTDFSLLRWLMGWDYDIEKTSLKLIELGGLMCQDDEGNVVYMQALARTHPRSLIRAGGVSDLFRLSVVEAELAFKLVRKAEEATGRKLGAKLVIDLDEFSMDVLYPPALNVYLNLLTLLQALFPDFGRHIYVINCPMMIKTVYAMIQPVLSKQTREKVTFLGNDWKDVLLKELGAHNIYSHWGGTKPSELPTGDIRMGGKVPEKLQFVFNLNIV
ncbi:CRAL/TRIO domain protein [Ancylostoma ceylanicum]|uniref:CRAL/TRIO domain protein n=1 Tax=Ancylostoma ceylanicum TaxID=53326 RepID=A0A0D6LKZ5_9BILA|nr:CRAL/TRIO domain protein [Ancylostoma ceylanicum]